MFGSVKFKRGFCNISSTTHNFEMGGEGVRGAWHRCWIELDDQSRLFLLAMDSAMYKSLETYGRKIQYCMTTNMMTLQRLGHALDANVKSGVVWKSQKAMSEHTH